MGPIAPALFHILLFCALRDNCTAHMCSIRTQPISPHHKYDPCICGQLISTASYRHDVKAELLKSDSNRPPVLIRPSIEKNTLQIYIKSQNKSYALGSKHDVLENTHTHTTEHLLMEQSQHAYTQCLSKHPKPIYRPIADCVRVKWTQNSPE